MEVVTGEEFPDLVVREEGDEEGPMGTAEVQPQYTIQATDDVYYDNQYNMATTATEEEDQRFEAESAPQQEQESHRELESEIQPEQEVVGDEEGVAFGEDSGPVASEDGAYHAARREEDLEQYCMERGEEETSEVSDEVAGEASAYAMVVVPESDEIQPEVTHELQEEDQSYQDEEQQQEQEDFSRQEEEQMTDYMATEEPYQPQHQVRV